MPAIKVSLLLLLVFGEVISPAASPARAAPPMREFPIPTSSSGPWGITAGADGNLWFTEHTKSKIGRVTTTGVFTEFRVPTPTSHPRGITSGADGNLWFTEDAANKIGRVTPAGAFTEFLIPTPSSIP